mmetsp:Transcript_17832/g.35941  ORF Transcript_17832/g.35941 Transcript_17832/m.35941 type:complete len:226 (-) Transcript_17832:13-690(-)
MQRPWRPRRRLMTLLLFLVPVDLRLHQHQHQLPQEQHQQQRQCLYPLRLRGRRRRRHHHHHQGQYRRPPLPQLLALPEPQRLLFRRRHLALHLRYLRDSLPRQLGHPLHRRPIPLYHRLLQSVRLLPRGLLVKAGGISSSISSHLMAIHSNNGNCLTATVINSSSTDSRHLASRVCSSNMAVLLGIIISNSNNKEEQDGIIVTTIYYGTAPNEGRDSQHNIYRYI